MKLFELTESMRDYNADVAPGSECNAWQDFVGACFADYKIAPWDDKAADMDVENEFADYWLSVADGNCSDYSDE